MATIDALKRVNPDYTTDAVSEPCESPQTFTIGADILVTGGPEPLPYDVIQRGYGHGFAVREWTEVAWWWETRREGFGGIDARILHVTFDPATDRWGEFDDWDTGPTIGSFWLRACHVVEELTTSPF